MRIAQVANLFFPIPPRKYGAVHRIISYLTEEFVRQGHEVTLFASGDSVTKAKLIAPIPECLAMQGTSVIDLELASIMLLEAVFKNAGNFDVIHFHERLHFPLSRRYGGAHVTTIHTPMDQERFLRLHREYIEMPIVAVSEAQRLPAPWLHWQATIYNGLPEHLYSFHEHQGKYLAYLGRMDPEKGLDKAIQIAKQSGMRLMLAGPKTNARFFEETLRGYLRDPHIEYVGEIGDKEKNDFLGNAYALLFPITVNESLGTVVLEALACGTPVIAFRRGSVAEQITDGVNGFIVENADEAIKALEKIPGVSRKRCRQVFEERFTVTRMYQEYLALYEKLCGHS